SYLRSAAAFLVLALGLLTSTGNAATLALAWDPPTCAPTCLVSNYRIYSVPGPCPSETILMGQALHLVSIDSQELVGENGAGTNAVDNNTATFWHTEWYQHTALPPHTLVLDLGARYQITRW